MKNLIIFGTADIAEVAHFYFTRCASYEVTAFCVDEAYIQQGSFCGLPVIPSEELLSKYPPANNEIFVAVSYTKMNKLREQKYLGFKRQGYKFARYVSPNASVFDDVVIGENSMILEDNTIQPFSSIGDNCVLWSGNHIGHHSKIGHGSFITSHVVVSGRVKIGQRCFLGVNSTIANSLTIGDDAFIGPGALITKNVDAAAVVSTKGTEARGITSDKLKI